MTADNVLPLVRHTVKVSSGADDGAVLSHYARYAKSAVMTTFENIGGLQRFSEVADQDPKWFYEKFFAKMIPKEHEVQTSESVEDLLKKLDSQIINVTPTVDTSGEGV